MLREETRDLLRDLRKAILVGFVLLLLGGGSALPAAEVSQEELAQAESERQEIQVQSDREWVIDYWANVLQERNWNLPAVYARDIAKAVYEEMENQSTDPFLILAMIFVESAADPAAISHVGALGLMQVMPATGAYIADLRDESWPGPRHLLTNAELNIRYGTWYYNYLWEKFEDEALVLTAYNRGPGNTQKILRNNRPIPMGYANKVLNTRERLKENFYRQGEVPQRWSERVGEEETQTG